MSMEGGCHCGAIRFKVTGKLSWIGTCWCLDCRKISGTPAMTFAEFELDNLSFVKGTPKTYRSSEHVARSFCEICGSPLLYVDDEIGKAEIPVGAFDDIEHLAPREHIYVSRKPSWANICDDLPQKE